ncbi:type II secretion system F family protein [Pseudomonas syringae]|nr:type II secretion system F family protein [Pseudomonas syringae]MBD8803166.1 type II secretion system F family protein [Pseudomonas syringae]MBD8813986.1 type II secretion system F family protein [Pseudomonas syringae]
MNLGFKLYKWLFNAFDASRQEFYEDFASALRDGASDADRLGKMAARARKRKSGWAPLYEHWLRKMRRMTFARALQHTVPDYEVMVLTAAEEDGRLSEAMDYLGRAIRLSSKIKNAYFMSLISPAIALAILLSFFLAYALVIAPQNLQTLPLDKWPEVSRQLYAFSNLLVNGGVALGIGLGIAVWLVMWSRGQWRGRLRAWVDRVPMLPWRGYREREANTFLVAFAILLQSNNHGPKEALERMRQFASPWLSWHLSLMLKQLVRTPDQPARALNTGLFPIQLMDRIEDYAERTDFTKALRILAFDHGDKQIQAADRRAVITGFMTMLLVAAVIGVIVWANFEFNQALETYIQNIR